ncbi:MAG TPA: HutD family protein [Steroidobacteraceae bacterium]|nr:HutD family protein [Steroidobacteraceae bacterium]
MQIIRRSSLAPVPWKNGGGITHEMIRMPATGDPFLWRVSIAQIDASGPFSNFTGYSRHMVLLRGSGLRLRFPAGPDRQLLETGDMTEFDGAVATQCELLDGPCTDLNLMISASVTCARAWVERLLERRPLRPSFQGTVLAFAISGIVSVDLERRESTRLQAWDLAVISADEHGSIRPVGFDAGGAGRDAAAAPLVFFATVDDNFTVSS